MSTLCSGSLSICSSTTLSPAPVNPDPLGNNATSIILTHRSRASTPQHNFLSCSRIAL
jgi:hypothetical protein